MNVGKKTMMELDKVKEAGIIPSEFEKRNYLPWGCVTEQILKWKEKDKVICIKEGATPYISRYISSKYSQQTK